MAIPDRIARNHRVAGDFGMNSWPEEGLLTHSSQTAVIARDGKLIALLEGSGYAANQLGDLIALELESHSCIVSRSPCSRCFSSPPEKPAGKSVDKPKDLCAPAPGAVAPTLPAHLMTGQGRVPFRITTTNPKAQELGLLVRISDAEPTPSTS